MTYLGCREGIKRLPKKLTSIEVRCQGQSELNRKGEGRCEGRGKEHQVSLQNTWYTDMKRRKERWKARQDTLFRAIARLGSRRVNGSYLYPIAWEPKGDQ